MWSVQLLESIVKRIFYRFGKTFFQSDCIFAGKSISAVYNAPTSPCVPAEPQKASNANGSKNLTPVRYTGTTSRISVTAAVLATRSMNSHYQSLISLPDQRILTTSRCSHYQINEFSLPVAGLTARSMNSHYQSLVSLPDQSILTTRRYSHWQVNEFSLPVAVLTLYYRDR